MSILTIAIPTFNRSEYLHKCLLSLSHNRLDDVEILVLDNHSTDNTKKMIKSMQAILNLKYICHSTNIGPDENFKQCIREASSEYVWIFGDDDVFFQDSVLPIVHILKSHNNIGLLHLRAENFMELSKLNDITPSLEYNIFTDHEKFIRLVHTNITFLSANIFNKDITMQNVNLDVIPNNNLGQVYWNLVALTKGKSNIFIKSKIFGAKQLNSGNYNFCEVFGENFIEILDLTKDKYNTNLIINIIKKRLLIFYYPANIIRLRNGLSEVKYKNCFNILYPKFKFNIYFWVFTIPAISLPKKLGLFIIKTIERFK